MGVCEFPPFFFFIASSLKASDSSRLKITSPPPLGSGSALACLAKRWP